MSEDHQHLDTRTCPPAKMPEWGERTDAQKSPVHEVNRKPALRRISSNDLLRGACEMIIEHAGGEYRLRLTSKGKLILTK